VFGNVEIDACFIITQIIGFIATGIAIASFQAKRRITILALQTGANLLWMVHYLMLGKYSAVFANLLGAARNVIYGFRGKYKFADSKIIPVISVIVFAVTGVLTYTNPFDILPMLAMIFASLAFFVKEERKLRYMSLLIATPWLTFAVYAGSIAGIISDGSVLISIILAIIRYRKFDIYEKTTAVQKTSSENAEKTESEENDTEKTAV